MARMTTHQLKHLVSRIEKIYDEEYKLRAQQHENDLKTPYPDYSEKEKLELIRTKKASLKEDLSADTIYYQRFFSCFNYPETSEQKRVKKIHERAKNLRNVLFAEVELRKQQRIDSVVLGDADFAMSALRAEEVRVEKIRNLLKNAES